MPKPVVASFCSTFLKAEMNHIYRQVTGLAEFDTFVLTKERLNEKRFPFADIEPLPKTRKNFVRRYYLKHVLGAPAVVYRGEFQALFKIFARRPADLMHVYFGHTAVHLLPFIEAWDHPTVVSFHGMDVMLREEQHGYPELMRRMLEAVTLVMVRSESLRQRVIELGCPPEKIRLNRTGIPLEAFPLHPRTPPADGAWHFVQACRLIPKKGLATSLKAFGLFRDRFPSARFTIAGDGPLKQELRDRAADLGLGDCVRFHGFLTLKDLNDLYRQAHFFIHPSEETPDRNQEGIPNSMLEAMSTGLPVVATLHGGIPEAVDNGETGLLVPERDAEALAGAMIALAGHPDRWAKMGAVASVAVHANFEHKAQIACLESHYREAIAIRPPKPAYAVPAEAAF